MTGKMNHKYRLVFLWLLIGCVSLLAAASSGPKEENTIERVSSIMRQYELDVTELPLDVTSTIQKFDLQGKLVSTKKSTHRFEVTESRTGDNSKRTATLGKVERRSLGELGLADMTALMASFFFQPQLASSLRFHVEQSEQDALVSFRTNGACESFELSKKGFKLLHWCGEGKVRVDTTAQLPLEYSFESGGLPLTLGKKELRSCRATETFQTVQVEAGRRPFMLPKTVIVTIETEKRKTVITSHYELHKSK